MSLSETHRDTCNQTTLNMFVIFNTVNLFGPVLFNTKNISCVCVILFWTFWKECKN